MNISVEVKPRDELSRLAELLLPFIVIICALSVGALALLLLGFNPVYAYHVMFIDTMTTQLGLTEAILRSVPLVLTGLAVYIPYKAGIWNIGAEGQLFLGAIAGTWIALNVDAGPWIIPLTFVGAATAGAIWGAVPGYLLARFNVNEIITTLMMTFIGVELAGYLTRGPMQDPEVSFPVTESIPAVAELPVIPGTQIHIGVIVALAMILAAYVLFQSTVLGFEIRYFGANPTAAYQAGINSFRLSVLVLLLGGLVSGIAGIIEIMGRQGELRPGFSPGYGFMAVAIALLGRNGALQVGLAAAFFAVLLTGGMRMETIVGTPSAFDDVIVALVILFLLISEFLKDYQVSVKLTAINPGDTA